VLDFGRLHSRLQPLSPWKVRSTSIAHACVQQITAMVRAVERLTAQ
jgi:hypothetical protein